MLYSYLLIYVTTYIYVTTTPDTWPTQVSPALRLRSPHGVPGLGATFLEHRAESDLPRPASARRKWLGRSRNDCAGGSAEQEALFPHRCGARGAAALARDAVPARHNPRGVVGADLLW